MYILVESIVVGSLATSTWGVLELQGGDVKASDSETSVPRICR